MEKNVVNWNGKEVSFFIEEDKMKFSYQGEEDKKFNEELKSVLELIDADGVKLGNYHYHIELDNEFVYLTRYYEECANCPYFDEECGGDNGDAYADCRCKNMLPIMPYANNYDIDMTDDEWEEINSELNDKEKSFIKLIYEAPLLIKIYYNHINNI